MLETETTVEPKVPVVVATPTHHVPVGLKWLSYLVFMPLMAAATIGFGCVSLICGLWDKTGRQQHAVAWAWANVMLWISCSPMTLVHPERLRAHETAVYASNHLSYFDTPVLFAKLPFQFRILARAALWKVPFIGWYLNHSGQVPVNHTSPRSMVASLGLGVKTLAAGVPLVVFPESGRSPHGQTRKMVAGAAWMAIKAQVPLVPLTLVGTYELLPMRVYTLRPRPLKLVVGEPISTVGMTTREADALTQRVFEEITRTYMAEHS